MTGNINLSILSGSVGWVKKSYTKNGEMFISFIIRQPVFKFEDNKLVSKTYNMFVVVAFGDVAQSAGKMKEGIEVTMQGRLNSYKTDEGTISVRIVADKIDFHGQNNNAEKQAYRDGDKEAPV